MTITAIETHYAGCRFRSRLEARCAVFFNAMGIPWMYEPEGYVVNGRAYLPDFYLPECATWVEVKGSVDNLDLDLLRAASRCLPDLCPIGPVGGLDGGRGKYERGPKLMLLGSIPTPLTRGDYGWIVFDNQGDRDFTRWGFGTYHKNHRPWWLVGDNWPKMIELGPHPSDFYYEWDSPGWLVPTVDSGEWSDAQTAYAAARSARFEHGQSGA